MSETGSRTEIVQLPPDPDAECICYANPETGFRFDIVCPRHDGDVIERRVPAEPAEASDE